jgi:peptide/nickel transport system substrate-binding protein
VTVRRTLAILAFVTALSLMAAACGRVEEEESRPPSGGALRLGLPTWATVFTYGDYELDPQATYYFDRWELFRCCLLRTLLSYNGRPTEEGGADLHPDLAASMPDVSPDGLEWTFRLTPAIRYAPPLQDVEVTAGDVVRAIERALTPAPRAARPLIGSYLGIYSFYYLGVIEGTKRFANGAADTISGLQTPDDHTLVVRLTQPVGDLGYRFSLAASAPIPPNPHDQSARLGAAEGHDDGYGRFLIASGPYMLEGSEGLDLSLPPERQRPLFGTEPGDTISFVRNPSWDGATDDLRPAYPDRIELSIEPSAEEAVAKVERGELDSVFDMNATVDQVETYGADPELQPLLHIERADMLAAVTMNLAMPPFDDVHVRRAVNYAIDKAHLRELAGSRDWVLGSLYGVIGTHIAANSVERNLLLEYDPYPTPGHRGSLEDARLQMARSIYDSDVDGVCDDPACTRVRAIVLDGGPFPQVANAIRDDLRAIGIDLDVEPLGFEEFFGVVVDPTTRVPLTLSYLVARDYPSGSAVFMPYFYGPFAGDTQNYNVSRVGASPEQLRRWGYSVRSVPSVDEKIEECIPLMGSEQVSCWAEVDKLLMEEVVPFAPYLFVDCTVAVSSRVANYSVDQFTTYPAPDHMAVVAEPG